MGFGRCEGISYGRNILEASEVVCYTTYNRGFLAILSGNQSSSTLQQPGARDRALKLVLIIGNKLRKVKNLLKYVPPTSSQVCGGFAVHRTTLMADEYAGRSVGICRQYMPKWPRLFVWNVDLNDVVESDLSDNITMMVDGKLFRPIHRTMKWHHSLS